MLRNYYTSKWRNQSRRGAAIQSDVEIHNFEDNNDQYDIMELLQKYNALT